MSSHTEDIKRVTDIVSRTTKSPTIVNPDSRFVVVTYWWGRGNYNGNTARPCIAFFEQFIQNVIKIIVDTGNTVYIQRNESILTENLIKNLIPIIFKLEPFKKNLNKFAVSYLHMIYEYCGLKVNLHKDSNAKIESANIELIKCLDKRRGKDVPANFHLYSKTELIRIFQYITIEIIRVCQKELLELIKVDIEANALKEQFEVIAGTNNKSGLDKLKKLIDAKNIKKKDIRRRISEQLKKKRASKPSANVLFSDTNTLQLFKNYEEKVNIYDILNDLLRYQSPIKFEEMIDKWERICAEQGCNYLSVEYPEFAAKGGYQLAINAKPVFIKKALELCQDRAVVYIDGDMFVRKYPQIFDMPDVDFMARGWWIDPRSSYKMEESIMYDPYTFETSGGIMYFSQTRPAKFLIDKWIEIAAKPLQAGKADDRVLSLVFNSYKMLLNMKIIQLPIEYLWLTLDYDERLREMVYDYNDKKMRETIYVEHPECLTTEETAAGAGAASDRTPKFYDFLGDYLVPVSETVHEYLMFPNKEMTAAFKDYYTYMDGITYLDDGNEDLYKKGFVNPEEPDYNEQPLYIISYDKQLGDKPSPNNSSLTYNQVSKLNFDRARKMNIKGLKYLRQVNDSTVEIKPQPTDDIPAAKLIALIIKLLLAGKTVIYNPEFEQGYDVKYYNKLINNLDGLYGDLELVFVPIIKGLQLSDFFRPGINLTQPVLFRPGNDIMIRFLSMYLSLDSVSDILLYGSYEFMSRVRVGYLKKDKVSKEPLITKESLQSNTVQIQESAVQVGGEDKLTRLMNEYEFSLQQVAERNRTNGGRRTQRRKKYRLRRHYTQRK